MDNQPTQIAPPPWHLQGKGYIFLFHFSREFVENNGFLAQYQQEAYNGSLLGTVMLVDYETSGVGPYKELLFVPGQMPFKKAPSGLWSISKIYVSSADSVWNGKENWGIPKELADFSITQLNAREEVFEIKTGEKVFFKAHLKKGRVNFPITTKFFPLKLAQKLRNNLVITNSPASGKASFAKLIDIKIDSQYFPDISKAKLLAILSVKDFKMTFPVPDILQEYFKEKV